MPGALDNYDINGILAQLLRVGPTEDEKRQAGAQALTRTGLGILAANQPSRMPQNPMGILAQGATGGLDAYQGALDRQGAERKQSAAGALQALQIKKQMEQQQALAGLLSPPSGGVQPAGGTPQGGMLTTGAPTAPGPSLPPGYTDIPLGKLQALAASGMNVEQFLKLRDAAQPKLENVPGIGMVDPRTGQPVVSMPRITDSGRAAGAIPDGKGGWTVQVPQGSVNAYSQFQNADEQAKAAHDLVTVPPSSPNAPPTFASRASLLPGGGAPPGPGGPAAPGVPPGQRPAAGMSPAAASQQAADAAQRMEISKNYGQIYNQAQNAAMQNPAKVAKLQRIGTLLGDFEGGKLSATGLEVARTANSLGIKLDPKLSNKEASEALTNEVALELRSTGSGAGMPGAMSDADREFLKGMTPQMAQTAEGRRTIIESRVKVLERENQVSKMARQYKQKYGTLNEDFFNQLSGWSERNPIFKK
jgi:hypothetical protein